MLVKFLLLLGGGDTEKSEYKSGTAEGSKCLLFRKVLIFSKKSNKKETRAIRRFSARRLEYWRITESGD